MGQLSGKQSDRHTEKWDRTYTHKRQTTDKLETTNYRERENTVSDMGYSNVDTFLVKLFKREVLDILSLM